MQKGLSIFIGKPFDYYYFIKTILLVLMKFPFCKREKYTPLGKCACPEPVEGFQTIRWVPAGFSSSTNTRN